MFRQRCPFEECTVTHLAVGNAVSNRSATKFAPCFRVLVAFALATPSLACVGIDAGVDYPGDVPAPDESVASPDPDGEASIRPNGFVIKDDVCKDIDTHAVTQKLSPEDFARYLESRGLKIEPRKARDNLYWFDFPSGEAKDGEKAPFVRLRLAVLRDQFSASRDLHESLLDHGPGWWGLRRSNLAILAPKADLSTALGFALKHKLVCWGMFAYSGTEDVYVVPGPYTQL
jgi:hypothetical protein